MYLTEINEKTGLVDTEKNLDGVLAIKAFRDIINDKKLGIQCFTCIALTADYQSPIRYYSENDRPKKAMEEVTGKRTTYDWNTEKIQVALKTYDDLQYDPTVEEGRIHYQRKVNMMKKLRESEEKYGKGELDENGKEILYRSPAEVAADLRKINADLKEYEKMVAGKEIYGESPVKNGYKLSRLEQKALKRNSFYQDKTR